MLWRPKRAPRIGIALAVRQCQLRPDRPRIRTRQQKVGQATDALRVEPHPRAEEQDEAPLASLQPDVGGAAVAKILGLAQNRHLWELVRHCRGRAIGRVVVDHHRLHGHVGTGEEHLQGQQKVVFRVPIDDQRSHQRLG